MSGGKRLGLGCLAPLALAGLVSLMWGLWWVWLYRVPESLWMWTAVGPPLVLTVERLAGPLLGGIPRGPRDPHSPGSRAKSVS